MNETKNRILTMALALAALGSAANGEAARPDDPTPWSCMSTANCKDIKTLGTIPRTPDVDELVHIVQYAKFQIIDKSAYFELRLADGEWLPIFLDLRLAWKPDTELMPEGSCPDKDEELKALRGKRTVMLPFSRFASDALELHAAGKPPKIVRHYLSIYPIRDTDTLQKKRYCVMLTDEDSGLHNGAVHGEND